jgi:hypothetical protein
MDPRHGEKRDLRHTAVMPLVLLLTAAAAACDSGPTAPLSDMCGLPPGTPILSVSQPPAGNPQITVALVAEHRARLADITLSSAGPDSRQTTAQYVEAADWICLIPQDESRAGETVVARVSAVGELIAEADEEADTAAEAVVVVIFTPQSRIRREVQAPPTVLPTAYSEVLQPEIPLGAWFRFTSYVNVNAVAAAGGSSRAGATLTLTVQGASTSTGTAVPLRAVEAAAGAAY